YSVADLSLPRPRRLPAPRAFPPRRSSDLIGAGRPAQRREPLRDEGVVALGPQSREPASLALLGVTRDLENLDGVVVVAQVIVHADQDATARLDIALELLGGARDLPLEPAAFDSLDHATHRLDCREQALPLALQLIGARLHEVGAA